MHEEHEEDSVGPTSEPQVVAAPASHATGGEPPPLLEEDDGEEPHASLFGTQTLTWSPAYEVSVVHVVPEPHSSPFGHATAQKVSP